jgi:voltage-gated potassium channel
MTTTVGYGDEYPRTTLGRALAMAIMLIGIGFIAILTGAVAERFLSTQVDEVAEVAHEVEATDTEVLAELREVRTRFDRLEARLSQRVT